MNVSWNAYKKAEGLVDRDYCKFDWLIDWLIDGMDW